MESPIARCQRILGTAPFITDLGILFQSLEPGGAKSTLELKERHLQQDGFVHAGVQATIADHTAGAAAATLVAEGQIVLTAEFKINLLRPARGERLVCRSKVLKAGRTLIVVESEVSCCSAGRESLVSKAIATIAVVQARQGGSPSVGH